MKSSFMLITGAICVLALAALALMLGPNASEWDVVISLRVPRIIAALCSGALLATAGLSLQTVLRNPLADPFVLGTSGGASVGALVMILLGGTVWLGSFIGAITSILLLAWLMRRTLRGADDSAADSLLLAGVMIAAFTGAATQLLLALLPDEQFRGAVFWLVGDLSGAVSVPVLTIATVLILITALLLHRAFALLPHGEREAFVLGLPVARARGLLLLLAAASAAVVVTNVGAIGFAGLVAPHLARRLAARFHMDDARGLIMLSALIGAAFVLIADTAARTIALPLELPTGAVMACLGAPMFVWVLKQTSHRAG
jgi:iron complex transport system permease protein